MSDSSVSKHLQARIEALTVLLVGDGRQMLEVHEMLAAIGVKTICEANDGMAGVEAIRALRPDIVIVDWEMPVIGGAQFASMVRSPDGAPASDVPIVMLTGHGDRWRVVEAARIGVHEFLLKPVSAKALLDRVVSILDMPRPTGAEPVGGFAGWSRSRSSRRPRAAGLS